MRRLFFLGLVLAFFIFSPRFFNRRIIYKAAPAYAAQELKSPVVCNGDKVEYFEKEKKIVATGDVVITYKDITLTSDKVSVWTETKDTEAEGNVKITQGENVYEGEKMRYNLEKQSGDVIGFRASAPPWYAKGKTAERVSKDEFIVKHGFLSTCDHKNPHWKLSADKVFIYPNKVVKAYNAVSWFRPYLVPFYVPLMWIPYYAHPLDDKPSVTVIPGKDKDWGYFLLTAWRYDLTPNNKGYVRFDYRENKDIASGVDHIYDTNSFGNGIIKAYYMNERDVTLKHNYLRLTKKRWPDGFGHEKDFSWDPTTEEEKGLFRIRHQWDMGHGSQLTAELHKYKDEDFLKDYFYNEFEKNEHPPSYLLFTNTNSFANTSLYINKRANRFDTTTEKLPELQVNVYNKPIFELKRSAGDDDYGQENIGTFYYTGGFKAVNLNEVYPRHTDENPGRITDPQHNSIFDLNNRFSYNTKLGFLNITPFAGVRQTYFSREVGRDNPRIRGVFNTGIDASTKFFRVFNTKASPLGIEINDLRHIVTPTLSYGYTPPPTMAPGKVFGDGISRSSKMGLSLENKLQTKRGYDRHTVDLAMLLVTTSYNFNHNPGTQFEDYTTRLELRPFDWLVGTSDAIIDSHKRSRHRWLKELNNDLSIDFKDRWSLGLGHRYVAGANRLTYHAKLRSVPGWYFSAYGDFDILATRHGEKKKHDLKGQEYIITKDLHCWDMDIRYNIDRDKGEEIMLTFRLKAFPGIPFEFGRSYHKPKFGSQNWE